MRLIYAAAGAGEGIKPKLSSAAANVEVASSPFSTTSDPTRAARENPDIDSISPGNRRKRGLSEGFGLKIGKLCTQ